MKFEIIGREYSETPSYYTWDVEKRFPKYEQVNQHTWNIEADYLDVAVTWLADNHPEAYMGANVIGENGDFSMMAVPCEEYPNGSYETVDARIAWVKEYGRR